MFAQYKPSNYTTTTMDSSSALSQVPDGQAEETLAVSRTSCFYRSYDHHLRHKCPAKDATCKSCDEQGHFQKAYRASTNTKHAATSFPFLVSFIITAAAPTGLGKAITEVTLNGVEL
ncbi:hypothetical protein FGIG_05920 [Fasciola gigantica]|uniref:Uncharacterized protein n=1 Tax=Fasciola gigantica TaxID=46835 RepID=A0A504YUB8_FASGI|nr:hypothetical protein FGIG_05920 [Fasciola gigantica]